MKLTIQPWGPGEAIPYDLLLLADPSKEMVDDYVARGRGYGAYTNGEVAGEYVLIDTHPKTVEIVNIAVREDLQGRGIGKMLVESAIEEARRLGAHAVEIGTANSSFLQLKLYQRCGFRIVGVDAGFFIRHYEEVLYEEGIQVQDMIRLRLDLNKE
ncbi:N-acetyltransferase [Paenibacillus sp. XY044]|uniref:GNAT family N-acetyltransferase n=1 Tax=Paenibacillus sp. XY044 TaxID=2026089 RepID=UPI000B9812CF|nr:GNAT family N-acetyltransferase [Paenibacillus sp. XY044]OZB97945.1 GNAT family N-acetyltransferase [Paenibacillus sp. XY044]